MGCCAEALILASLLLAGLQPPVELPPAAPAVALANKLSHADAEQRLTAARELLLLAEVPAAVLEPLQAALACPDAEVRQVAALLLARMGKPAQAALPRLEALVQDAEPRVRAAALTALVRLTAEPATLRPLLLRRLEDVDADVRQAAVLGLAAGGPGPNPSHVGVLRARLRDTHPQVRRAAAFALGKWGAAALPAVPALEKLCADPDLELRFESAWALFRINRAPVAVDVFRAALGDRRQEVFRAAGAFLAENLVEGNDLAPLVRALLESTEGTARFRVVDLFYGVSAEAQAVAAVYLVSKLGDEKWDSLASSALTRLGRNALPALHQAASSGAAPLRERASELVRRIERNRPTGPRRPPD